MESIPPKLPQTYIWNLRLRKLYTVNTEFTTQLSNMMPCMPMKNHKKFVHSYVKALRGYMSKNSECSGKLLYYTIIGRHFQFPT